MKHIFYLLPIIACLASCMEIDNFDAPEAKVSGRIIDATTGENMMFDQNDTKIRIWERSYSLKPEPQDLAVKADGTYKNTKLFAGTYNMLPYNGAYWPCDTTFYVPIGRRGTVQDFYVTPYLHLLDFKYELVGLELTMSCRLHAPIIEEMPQVQEIRPFLSLNQHCGYANHLGYYWSDDFKVRIMKPWEGICHEAAEHYSKETYSITVPVKAGYTYWCRLGAKVNNAFENYNYTETVKIEVPADAK